MDGELAGLSVVITRAADQQSDLAEPLERRGASVIALGLLAIAAPADGGRGLRRALERVERFDWVVVTSPNGARAVIAHLHSRRPRRGFAAVGPGTASVFAEAGIPVDLVAERSLGEGLVEAFGDASEDADGTRPAVLAAQAEAARPVVADGLRAKGYDVTSVVAYRSVDAPVDEAQRRHAARADVVLFTSSSMVERYLRLVGVEALPPTVGAIGPITAETARAAGITVAFSAREHTLEGLVEALVRWVETSRVGE